MTPFLVQQLTEDPYFIEHKLKMIEKFLPTMDQNTMLKLVEQLSEMIEVKNIEDSYEFFNTHPLIIRVLIVRLSMQIQYYMPSYEDHIKGIKLAHS